MNRLGLLAVVLLWIVSMGWLIQRDLLPRWRASDPPPAISNDWIKHHGEDHQLSIIDKYGRRIGTCWTTYQITPQATTRRDDILLHKAGPIGSLLIHIDAAFLGGGVLDMFSMEVLGQPLRVSLRGERVGPDFPFELTVGPVRQTFRLESADVIAIGNNVRPFALLPGLRVGQSWYLELFNPVSALVRGTQRFVPMLVEVTGRETIMHRGQEVECFLVEAGGVKAWVDDAGCVLKQQAPVPGVGRITLISEPYDEESHKRAHDFLERRPIGR